MDTRQWTERTLCRRYDAHVVVAKFSTVEACADAFDTEVRTVFRWLADGLSVESADEVATKMGVEPNDVWPTWFEDALYDTEPLTDDGRRDRSECEGQLDILGGEAR